MVRQPISPAPVAFIYPTPRGLFASDLLADRGEKATATVTDSTLRTVVQQAFRSLRGARVTGQAHNLANLASVVKLIAEPYGVEVIHLPANREMTARIMLRKRQI